MRFVIRETTVWSVEADTDKDAIKQVEHASPLDPNGPAPLESSYEVEMSFDQSEPGVPGNDDDRHDLSQED